MRQIFLSLVLVALSACATPPDRSIVMKRIHLPVQESAESGTGGKRDFNSFLIAYHQQVFDLLMFLRTQPVAPRDDTHFLILEVGEQQYVQCLLHDGDTQADCEVASGLWGPNAHMNLSPKLQRIVTKQGFALNDNPGNYQLDINDAAGPERLWDVADLMLELLYRVYDAKIGDVSAVFPAQAAP